MVGLSTSLCFLICCASLNSNLRPQWRVLSQEGFGEAGPYASIIFFDELNGLALNALGLASTTDGGAHWIERLDSGNRGFYRMRFVNRQKGWIIGAERKNTEEDSVVGPRSHKPMIVRTEDGGITWREIKLDRFLGSEGASFSAFHSMCLGPSGTAWIVGDGGIVEATIESDALQTSHVTMTGAELNDVSCLDSGEVWATGRNGLIMHYQQGKWESIQYPDRNVLFGRVKVIGNAVWLIGGIQAKGQNEAHGLLLKIQNGNTWENKTPDEAGQLYDLDLTGNEGWLVGAKGNIYHTSNGGSVWRKEMGPTENDLFSIFLLNKKRGWIGGDKLTVLGLNTN